MNLLDKIKSVLGMGEPESESTGGNIQPSGERDVTTSHEAGTNGAADIDVDTNGRTETSPNTDDGEAESADLDTTSGEEARTLVDTDAGVEPAEATGNADTETGPAAEPAEAAGPVSESGMEGAGTGPVTGIQQTEEESEPGEESVSGSEAETDEESAGSEQTETKVQEKEEDETEVEGDSDGADTGSESAEVSENSGAGSIEENAAVGTQEPANVIKGVGPTYAETLGKAGIETVADLAVADPEDLAAETDISRKRIERWIGRAQHR